ncbi:hypothetical protein KL929_003559 [Ogataea haglerorum]|nr:hypothetical protein KL951_003591 [Ogataea haglerorum]KAG7796368.1 hypothetical protein KL929_003559 [Ogataea haglerorum]
MAPAQSLLLNTGRKIPTVGLGVYKTPAEQCISLIYEALNVGYRHIDSAALYDNEEEVCEGIAQWLAEDPSRKREDIFYTTKIGDGSHGYEKAKNAIKVSLEKAKKIQYIDLILIHSPQSDGERRHGTWKALEEAYEAGTVKNIGVSNYGVKHLKELLAYSDLKRPESCRPRGRENGREVQQNRRSDPHKVVSRTRFHHPAEDRHQGPTGPEPRRVQL